MSPLPAPEHRRWWILAAAALLFLCALGSHDLWAPDEPYFGEGAREMVVDGQWVVPHVNGEVTTDKPPLFFWAIALLSLPLGEVTPWTARLPSTLAALATLLLIMRLARRLHPAGPAAGERTAWLACAALATMAMFWEKARWAQIDMLLCLLIWIALSAFESWRAGAAAGRPAGGRRAGWLFWLACALAVLAKGPVGLLLPLGIATATLVVDRRLTDWKRFAPVTGPLLFIGVTGAWVAATVIWPAGDYTVWGALREHFVDRGLHGMHHPQPFWYYLEVLPVQLLPFSALLPGALVLAWRRRTPGDRFLLVACLFVVLFFSISTEKRDLYILPALPAFALLIARLVDSLAPRPAAGGEGGEIAPAPVGGRWLFVGQAILGGLLTLAAIALPIMVPEHEELPLWMAWAMAVILSIAGLATLHACHRRAAIRAALTPAAGVAVGYLFVALFVYPALEPRKSSRPFALAMAEASADSRTAGNRVVAYDLSNLPEAFAFHTDGLYTVTTEEIEPLAEHLAQPQQVWAAMDREGLDLLPEQVRDRLSIVREERLSRKDVLLVTNRPGGLSD